ncbi:MAG: hypothetical protein K1X89_16220 [Myxococcaceae bacterium]|nr:hypothetical protein [Myxococcaceae bacterium]
MRALPCLAAALVLAGCGNDGPLGLEAGCQPLLAGKHCLLPYPSDFFRTPAGRIEVPPAAQLKTARGALADVHQDRARLFDGFSRLSTVVAVMPTQVAWTGLTRLADAPGDTLTPTSARTVWLDADSLEPVPHFVDLDPRATDLSRQAIVLHALVPLLPSHRYVLAFQKLEDPSGAPVPAPKGFSRLRDGRAAGDPQLEALKARFESGVFGPLTKAGLERKGLQLAWDFTTGADETAQNDLLTVRALTMDWLAGHTPAVTVTSSLDTPSPGIWRVVKGTIQVPLFLDKDEPGGVLFRGADGGVAQHGETTAPFIVVVPLQALDGGVDSLGYGHGFFGTLNELDDPVGGRPLSDKLSRALFCVDWQGMSTADIARVVDDLQQRPSVTMHFAERVNQAMANFIVMQTAVPGPVRALAELQTDAGVPALTTTANGFLGISEGHLLGGVLSAVSPRTERYVGNVGGAAFTHLMFRAEPFAGFLFFLEEGLKDPLDQQAYTATLQRPFDTIDPGFWAPLVVTRPPPGSPARKALLQTALGDTSVPNLGAFFHARALGATLLTPSPREVYGLPAAATADKAAITLWDYGVDTAALYRDAMPGEKSPLHLKLRTEPTAQAQMRAFFESGTFVQPCGGPCTSTP